ncbi:MAG: bifunctional metallophosphatase/5'-nucleotidase [Alphaproteobacteria bacterium]|nr:bifunctional metallophosphatase/5'-nucleotidase [Alphaproteobacteria bacterium]
MRFFSTALFLGFSLTAFSASAENYFLELIHTNDLHSHFLPFKVDGSVCENQNCMGGFARLKAFVDEKRQENPHLVLLDAGDRFSGTVFYTLRKGKDIPSLLNPMNYDLMALGNHDFDDGLDELKAFEEKMNAPLLSANTVFPKGHALEKSIHKAFVLHKNNRQIGVISLLTMDAKVTSAKASDISLTELYETAVPLIEKLKNQGVDIIILLNHVGVDEDIKLASQLTDVDIIVSAHTHTLLSNNPNEENSKGGYPVVVPDKNGKNVLIVSAGYGGHHVGHLKAIFDEKGEVVSFEGDTVPMDEKIMQDKEITAQIKAVQQEVNAVLNEKIFIAKKDIPLTPNALFCSQSCYIGEVLTSVLLAAAKKMDSSVDFAFLNAGGIRAGLRAGEVTFQNIAQSYPFDSKAVIVKIKGEDLESYLNFGLKDYVSDDRTNAFIQTAGMGYLFSGKDKKIKRIFLDDGELDLTKEYLVVMPSFLAKGGDGFPMLEIVKEISTDTIRNVMIDILKEEQNIQPFQTRIKKMFD